MKPRTTPLLVALLSGLTLAAQPVLDATNNVPAPGTIVPVEMGTYEGYHGAEGANATYTFWMLESTTNKDIAYLSPSVTPTSAQIPGTQLLSTDGGSDTLFWAVTAQGLVQLGVRSSLEGILAFTDPILEIAYPCTFGTTWTDATSSNYVVSGLPVTRVGTITGHADGYGTVELPNAVVADVMRVHVRKVITDQAAITTIERKSDTYYYFSETFPHPVLRLTTDSVTISGGAPAVTYTSQWMFGPGNAITESDLGALGFTMAPNPVHRTDGQVELRFGTSVTAIRGWRVMDAAGRQVLANDVGQSGDVIRVPVSTLAPGAYLVQALGVHDEVGTRRLMVH